MHKALGALGVCARQPSDLELEAMFELLAEPSVAALPEARRQSLCARARPGEGLCGYQEAYHCGHTARWLPWGRSQSTRSSKTLWLE